MADISALIVGGIGSIAGIVALIYAHIAYTGSKESTRIANEGRDLAVEANDIARQSNTIATGAREIAQDANEISRRGEARETERHDVHWEGDWDQPGRYVLTKLGDDEACYIKATITYDDEKVTKTVESIRGSGQQLVFEFPTAVADFRREAADHTRQLQVASNATFNLGVPWGQHLHSVVERVEWTTPQGNPKLFENTANLSSFDHFYPDSPLPGRPGPTGGC
jgi:hypothetical protein